MNLVIVGATGLVGRTMLEVLAEREFAAADIIAAASPRSVGKRLWYRDRELTVCGLEEAVSKGPGIALFSAGSVISKDWAERFSGSGFTVIDNSSAWRRNESIPLVVPEINGDVLSKEDRIIANPNCSTIQMVLALAPLHKAFGVKRIIVSTYQSVTGSGLKGVQQLSDEEKGRVSEMHYPHPIHHNLIPQGGEFLHDGYTAEEDKLIFETRKILRDPGISVSPTVVRVPVLGGHSESINVELKSNARLSEIRELLTKMPGITLQDEPERNLYPMPRHAEGKDDVFVGRLRTDPDHPNTFNMWVVSDNLRKGAATNAVQIAEYLVEHQLV